MIGSFAGGRFCDKFGRKKVLFGSLSLIIPTVMFGGYSPNYICYLLLRLISCSALPCVWIASHTTTLELFDPEHRSIESRQPCYDKYTISGYATETVGVTLLGFLGLGHHPSLNPCNPRILLVPKTLKSMH